MAENPIGAIAMESGLVEEVGYSDDSTAEPIARKKKNVRKRRHGESTETVVINYANHIWLVEGTSLQLH